MERVGARATYALGIGSLAVTVWIWARTGQLDPILRRPWLLSLSEAYLTGLVASHLMVLQVVLMARLPWLERAWGRDVLVRRHRRLGYWSFWLMLLHVYLFPLQRTQREEPGRALWRVFVTDRWMLPATVGTVLVVVVVVTSIQGAVRRMRYESWHLVHLYAYLGMALALPHQLVSADFGPLWVRVWFLALYAGALAAVLWWRVLVPLARSRRLALKVVGVDATADSVSVRMAGRDLESFGARAGDFLTWRFLTGGLRGWVGHPYSLSAAPSAAGLRITVGRREPEASRLATVSVGTRVLVEGPYGALGTIRRRHPNLLLIAAGTGVTVVRALLEDARPGEATVLLRVGDRAPLLEETTELAVERDARLVVLRGHRTAGSWLPEGSDGAEILRELAADADVVLCGPAAWSDLVAATLAEVGVRRRDVHREEFGWFGAEVSGSR